MKKGLINFSFQLPLLLSNTENVLPCNEHTIFNLGLNRINGIAKYKR